jgi:hypothetical protein
MASPADIFGTFVDELAPTAFGPYERTVDTVLANFAELNADQNDLDYVALDAAVKTGRVKAQERL